MTAVEIYDTTLRDGSQQEGLSLTVADKLRVAEQLDHLGVTYVEGGWPGANPKDAEFFRRAPGELELRTATLVAFGSTRRPGVRPEEDMVLRQLVEAGTSTACIVAKASDLHVTEALRTSLEEAVAMVSDSVAFLRAAGLRVFLDGEHFFDGYRRDGTFAMRVLAAAEEAGAEALVLCDTNGGTLPDVAEQVVAEVRARTSARIGVHFHNDAGCAVASSLAAVRAGATHVQGCLNGYGERAGNADLCAVVANLSLKMGVRTIPEERLPLLTAVARHVAEIVNVTPSPQQPYVGTAAFAHKAGLHASAMARSPGAYEHVPPDSVGNGTRVVVSELAGRTTLELKARELGLELDAAGAGGVLQTLKELEHAGYHFEVADGSLELLMRAAAGEDLRRLFRIESFRVTSEWRADRAWLAGGGAAAGGAAVAGAARGARGGATAVAGAGGVAAPGGAAAVAAGAGAGGLGEPHPWSSPGELTTEATVKVHAGDTRIVATAEGNGPVNALDAALRKAIGPMFPELATIHLTDYRVRVLDSSHGTGAVTRVLIDSADAEGTWSTIGVSENIIESSWQALVDAIVLGLLRRVPAGVGPG